MSLPVARHFDPVVGMDLHLVQPPGPVAPMPIPQTYVGLVFEVVDYLPVLGATLYINGVPRAQAGSACIALLPHIPVGGVFVQPPANEGEVYMGSSTVAADGEALSYGGLPVDTCQDVGVVPVPRVKKKGARRSLRMPSAVLLAIPTGTTVGGAPTVSLMGQGMKATGALVGALVAKAKKARGARKAQNGVHCNGGHPVDVVTGANFDELVDAKTGEPGLFCWRRYYTTARANRNGVLGWGFRHEYQHELRLGKQGWRYEDARGRELDFAPLGEGQQETVAQGVVLRRAGERRYEIQEGEGPVQVLEARPGETVARLVQVRTEKGKLELRYEGKWLVELVEHTPGQACRYRVQYKGGHLSTLERVTPEGRIQEIASYAYDKGSHQVVARNAEGGEYKYEYNEAHRWTRMRDPNGYGFWWKYEVGGRCIETAGEDGLWWTKLEYEEEARQTRVMERTGGVSTHHYDANQTLRKLVDPYGGVLMREVAEDGRVVREVDSGGRVTHMVYDKYQALVGRVDPYQRLLPRAEELPRPPPPQRYFHGNTRLGYLLGSGWDELPEAIAGATDWLMKRVPQEWKERVEMLVRQRPLGVVEAPPPERRHGGLGQVVKEVDLHKREREWGHDKAGNRVWERDADGRVRQWRVGRWNLVVGEVDGLGNETEYEYTSTEQVKKVVDPGGTTSEYEYDEKDRLVRVRRHGEVKEEYEWDVGDRLTRKKDGKGNILLHIEHGPGGRTAVRHLASGGKHWLEWDVRGRATRASTEKDEVVLRRDAAGRVLYDLRNGRGVEHQTTARGRRTTVLGRYTWWVEETGWRVVVVDPVGGRHEVWRDRTGLVLREHANGSSELSHYTEKGRLRSVLRWRRELGAEQKPWWVRYELTPEGNLEGIWDGQSPKQRHYTLDAAQRLVAESCGLGAGEEWREEYRLDRAGNLVEKPGLRGVVLARGNRLAQANGEVFAYNTRHHVSERGRPGQQPTRYHYDSVDMLVRVEDGKGEPWTAEYDALHRRVRCGRGAQQTEYYWDGDRLAAELSPEGRLRVYVYAAEDSLVPLLLVDYSEVEATAESGHVYTLYTDQAGVPTHVEDSSGRTVWWATRVEPYGQVYVHPGSEVELRLRWPGHYADPDTGLYYNRHRYYDPVLGRYLQSDPLGLAGGLNLYAYAPNPLVHVDVLGLAHAKKNRPNSSNTNEIEEAPSHISLDGKTKNKTIKGEGFLDDVDTEDYAPAGEIFGQTHPGSCIAASCKMALNDRGHAIPEAYIRSAVKVDVRDGGVLRDVPDGLQEFGVKAHYKQGGTMAELQNATRSGSVIVSISHPQKGAHAIVVDGVEDGYVLIRDPWPVQEGASYKITTEQFQQFWKGKFIAFE